MPLPTSRLPIWLGASFFFLSSACPPATARAKVRIIAQRDRIPAALFSIVEGMGADIHAKSLAEPALYERYADHFPGREHLICLNHAAGAPLCRRAPEAMKRLADDCTNFGSLHYDQWLAAYEGVRVAAARLIGADRS